jgi:hypothetical protein
MVEGGRVEDCDPPWRAHGNERERERERERESTAGNLAFRMDSTVRLETICHEPQIESQFLEADLVLYEVCNRKTAFEHF